MISVSSRVGERCGWLRRLSRLVASPGLFVEGESKVGRGIGFVGKVWDSWLGSGGGCGCSSSSSGSSDRGGVRHCCSSVSSRVSDRDGWLGVSSGRLREDSWREGEGWSREKVTVSSSWLGTSGSVSTGGDISASTICCSKIAAFSMISCCLIRVELFSKIIDLGRELLDV